MQEGGGMPGSQTNNCKSMSNTSCYMYSKLPIQNAPHVQTGATISMGRFSCPPRNPSFFASKKPNIMIKASFSNSTGQLGITIINGQDHKANFQSTAQPVRCNWAPDRSEP